MAIIRLNPDSTIDRLDCGTELRALQHALGDTHFEYAGTFRRASGVGTRYEEYHLLVDEEGKLKNLPENKLATTLSTCVPLDVLVGPALIVRVDYDPETQEYDYTEIEDGAYKAIVDYLNDVREELQ